MYELGIVLIALVAIPAWGVALLLYVARCHYRLNEIRQATERGLRGVRADLAKVISTAPLKPARLFKQVDDPADATAGFFYCAACKSYAGAADASCWHCGAVFREAKNRETPDYSGGF
jgi:hypothetical protein